MMEVEEKKMLQEDDSVYPEYMIELVKKKKYFGRMNDPVGSAYIKGPCGDEMEVYLEIQKGHINDIKFYTDGCIATHVCGEKMAEMVIGKDIHEAMGVSPKTVLDLLVGLPEDHVHCAILAVSTLYKAIAEYLLKP